MFERVRAYRENRRSIIREKNDLAKVPRLSCNASRLRSVRASEISDLFHDPFIRQDWDRSTAGLDRICNVPDGSTGAVNPGDRRAIYYLIRGFKPRTVLEVGTDAGVSTVHIAAAMTCGPPEEKGAALVSVDIQNVNDSSNGPWKQYHLDRSPAQRIQDMGCDGLVTFVTQNSLSFLESPPHPFDFIFLDGSHAASIVYQEVPRALNALKENGLILLHDFFPRNQPLWSANRQIIPGPWMAVQRLLAEGATFHAHPLGSLPWPTKLGSNVTSLALLSN
jgi:predicted O-methyltransferase YrrM